MKFKYLKVKLNSAPPYTDKKYHLRPVIQIMLKNEGNVIRYRALIDSGADCNIFPAELTKLLGINLDECIKSSMTSISGDRIEVYYKEIIIIVGGIELSTVAGFAYHLFQGQGILDQNGFFDKYPVKFTFSKEEIEIKI